MTFRGRLFGPGTGTGRFVTDGRGNGSHHIFIRPGIPELVNLQNVDGKVKPYQVNQWLRLIERYNLRMEDDA